MEVNHRKEPQRDEVLRMLSVSQHAFLTSSTKSSSPSPVFLPRILHNPNRRKRKAKSKKRNLSRALSRGGPLHRRKRCLRKEPNKMNKTPRHDHHYINGTFESWTQNKTRTHTSRSNTSNNSSLQDREREAPFALGSGSTTCGAETLTNHIEAR